MSSNRHPRVPYNLGEGAQDMMQRPQPPISNDPVPEVPVAPLVPVVVVPIPQTRRRATTVQPWQNVPNTRKRRHSKSYASDSSAIELPRRSKRMRCSMLPMDNVNSRSRSRERKFVPPKLFRLGGHHATTINALPPELLSKILKFISHEDLYFRARLTCRHWLNVSYMPSLWTNISVETNDSVSTSVLLHWLRIGKRLRSINIANRNDANAIIETVSKYNKEIETIRIYNCWGSTSSPGLRSVPLCNLVQRCRKLYNYNLSQTKFSSCKFFRLISKDIMDKRVSKRCNYVGPMTSHQMQALFEALRNAEINDGATIGNAEFNQKFSLRQVIEYVQNDLASGVVNDVWQNLYFGFQDPTDRPIALMQ